MKQERNFIYSKDVLMHTIYCDCCLIDLTTRCLDNVIFHIILSKNDEYYIEAGISIDPTSINRKWVYISMERPVYIQEPEKYLSFEEKILLNDYADKYWDILREKNKFYCYDECAKFKDCGCSKYYNRIIPKVHPDYTLLPD